MSEASWAAMGALLTALILKVSDWMLSTSERRLKGRKDLREEVAALWGRLDDLEKEIEEWRGKYNQLNDKYVALNIAYIGLRAEYDALNTKYASLS